VAATAGATGCKRRCNALVAATSAVCQRCLSWQRLLGAAQPCRPSLPCKTWHHHLECSTLEHVRKLLETGKAKCYNKAHWCDAWLRPWGKHSRCAATTTPPSVCLNQLLVLAAQTRVYGKRHSKNLRICVLQAGMYAARAAVLAGPACSGISPHRRAQGHVESRIGHAGGAAAAPQRVATTPTSTMPCVAHFCSRGDVGRQAE
jgi:hypothetical protein